MAIYHVSVNGQDYELDSDSTVNAIKLALDEYVTQSTDNPDQCDIDDTTQGIQVTAEYAGDLISAVVP